MARGTGATAPPAAPPAGEAARAPWWRRTVDALRTAARRAMKGNVTDVAAALAYYAFLAIPAVLLVAVGVFGLVAATAPSTASSTASTASCPTRR